MKLMGAPRLFQLAGGESAAVRGACAALRAELGAGDWATQGEVSSAFPRAEWSNGRLVVAIDEQVCVVVAFNYRSGIALIESAGLRDALEEATSSKRRRVRS